jgi:hypothetical protein
MRFLSRFLLLLALSFPAAAADGNELQNLYKALDMLDQQQRAIYQQFQMVQALRRPARFYGVPLPGELTNYDEAVAAQERAIRREEDLYREADALLARYAEIEDLKKPLQARVYELSTER